MIIQGSPEWYASRCGVVNASEIHAVLSRNKDKTGLCVIGADGSIEDILGNGATAEKKAAIVRSKGGTVELVTIERGERSAAFWTLRRKIAAELMTGKSSESSYESADMRRGKELEKLAVMAYEIRTGEFVETTGGVFHERHPFVRASPDGLLADRGIEVKCPSAAVHLMTLENGMPDDHVGQVQAGIWICKKTKWDFISYHPDFKDGLDLYIETIHADYAIQREMDVGCREIWALANELVERIKAKNRST